MKQEGNEGAQAMVRLLPDAGTGLGKDSYKAALTVVPLLLCEDALPPALVARLHWLLPFMPKPLPTQHHTQNPDQSDTEKRL